MARAILAFSAVASLVFWATEPVRPFPGSPALKWLCIGTLAAWVWTHKPGRERTLLAVALLVHSVGDVLLEVDRERLLIAGIVPFLVGHLVYLATLLPHRRPLAGFRSWERVLAAGVPVYGAYMAHLLWPHLEGVLRVAVPLYLVAILSMTLTAVASGLRWAVVGALLYVASDSLIALDAFVEPLGWPRAIIWPTYYAGQLLIPLGLLRRPPATTEP